MNKRAKEEHDTTLQVSRHNLTLEPLETSRLARHQCEAGSRHHRSKNRKQSQNAQQPPPNSVACPTELETIEVARSVQLVIDCLVSKALPAEGG